ncbi:MAG: hypothetical protein KIS67_01620 [Verrucomicrobiae bacterium]|nr:hypothetical protein [Verrucomicrobiae bacterium]
MKISTRCTSQDASTLVIVLLLGAVSLFILASTMRWTAGTAALTDSAVRHSITVAAAEAATEKVVAELAVDFSQQGAAVVNSKVPAYKLRLPQAAEHAHWAKFKFSNGQRKNDELSVEMITAWSNGVPLISQYQGLKGYAATYRIKANARDLGATRELIGAVQQDVQLAMIPIFQFAIFYNLDLEINPGAPMTIGGRTHGNAFIYLQPAAALTFNGDVTSAGEIIPDKKPGDPSIRGGGSVTFRAEHDSGVMSLNLPIGTANTPEAVRQIVEIPPNNESVNSELGRQRFYNNADLVILVENNKVSVRGGGIANGNGPNLQWSSVSNFINLGKSFYDAREQKTIRVTEIDIAKFVTWNATANNALKNALKRDINSIYVADLRTQPAGTIPGVRLVNGATLPPLGLTVATPVPLYVKGHYNATGVSVGGNNTSNTKPAALIADAINVLSGSWSDANSTKSLSSRVAANTTVNAAFLAGIVETGNGYYSGGVENFPRFLENWSGKTFTYNGSMIVLYRSQFATGPWRGTGTTYNIYNPPNRNWYFDTNFLDPTKLPPLCPSVRAFIRGKWAMIAPNT